MQISEFSKTVMQNIKSVPTGRVATYKQIAELSGKPQASRGVSWILHSCATAYKLPWHRIINAQGKISFERNTHNYRKQKRLLEAEGVIFDQSGQLNLKKFQWKKKPAAHKTGPQLFSGEKK